jgi:hypothetical protein
MRKIHAISKEQIAEFPQEVQEQIYDTLKAYNSVSVLYEYGEWHVSSSDCLKAQYGADFKVYGRIYVDDIYTEEERTQNYIDTFNDYPYWYKGSRQYPIPANLRRVD